MLIGEAPTTCTQQHGRTPTPAAVAAHGPAGARHQAAPGLLGRKADSSSNTSMMSSQGSGWGATAEARRLLWWADAGAAVALVAGCATALQRVASAGVPTFFGPRVLLFRTTVIFPVIILAAAAPVLCRWWSPAAYHAQRSHLVLANRVFRIITQACMFLDPRLRARFARALLLRAGALDAAGKSGKALAILCLHPAAFAMTQALHLLPWRQSLVLSLLNATISLRYAADLPCYLSTGQVGLSGLAQASRICGLLQAGTGLVLGGGPTPAELLPSAGGWDACASGPSAVAALYTWTVLVGNIVAVAGAWAIERWMCSTAPASQHWQEQQQHANSAAPGSSRSSSSSSSVAANNGGTSSSRAMRSNDGSSSSSSRAPASQARGGMSSAGLTALPASDPAVLSKSLAAGLVVPAVLAGSWLVSEALVHAFELHASSSCLDVGLSHPVSA